MHTASEDEGDAQGGEEDEDEAEEEEDAIEQHEAEQVFGATGSKRPRRESTDTPFPSTAPLGISGAAGRRLTKKLKKRDSEGGFSQQHDFVQLMVPLSDEEAGGEVEEDEEMSVESDDLESEDDDQVDEEEEDEVQATDASAGAAGDASLPDAQPTSAAVHPEPATAGDDYVEFDYGDDDAAASDPDEEDDETVEQLLRR